MPKPKKEIRPHRRAFSFNTDESQVRVLRRQGQRVIIRPHTIYSSTEPRINAMLDYQYHRIFHALFPEYSIKPLGVARIEIDGLEAHGMTSEILKNRSPAYKAYQKWFYESRGKSSAGHIPPKAFPHWQFMHETAHPVAQELWNWGIQVKTTPVNVAEVKQQPVFFEIYGIDHKKLVKRLSEPDVDPVKKQKALKLLGQLERFLQ